MSDIIDEPSSLRALELQPVSSFRLSARALVHPILNAVIAASIGIIAIFGTLAFLPPDSPDRGWMPGGLALALIVLVSSLPATYVVVGADGILIRAPLYKRFLGFGDIEAVRTG